MTRATRCAWLAAALGIATILSSDSSAYSLSGPKWTNAPVPYYINPANLDLPTVRVVDAVRVGADAWQAQSGANFSFSFAGLSGQTTTTYDATNLVVFRNASEGSAIATTYWWSSGGAIVDADIVFWDGGFLFFSGSNGCAGGFYIEDIAAHEFGHALGLGHSTVGAATMYPSVSYCSTGNRTLDADDIAGVRALYPQTLVPPTGLRIFR